MGRVTATAQRTIDAQAETVIERLADYRHVRPRILTEHYRDYEVVEGGTGEDTVVRFMLQATRKRVRDVLATVSRPEPGTLVETDANSSMVTTWAVRQDGDRSVVRVETTWQGASGVGGFFERTFAPKGLRRIYDGVLAKLAEEVRAR
ncbi:SRPBCC family protein [Saccharomonospora xinjiangensis]|uniref:Polyketide cyclase / dehydrase and lipid transport n=1 Tax=Saccharomonospora xinjiangensis XJ-54 TaxID=882086 RepID=I0V1M5_9PSEU|nr:SRPBCC family protein [Saccharomonospora xinjiangensis]EID54028.1 Polyketide cyclase / dehydrase and lipid transport [Saccharomonospora xinjiangensis XJ-54]